MNRALHTTVRFTRGMNESTKDAMRRHMVYEIVDGITSILKADPAKMFTVGPMENMTKELGDRLGTVEETLICHIGDVYQDAFVSHSIELQKLMRHYSLWDRIKFVFTNRLPQ